MRLFILIAVAILICSCASGDKEVIRKQREGLTYPVSYQKAFQCAMSTLTKKGIAIHQIDKENGLITTLPHQIREEKYVYQIAIRPIDEANTAVSVVCIWSVSPGVDFAFKGIPSAVAKSKSKKLEIELADEIGREIMKPQIEKPHLNSSLEKASKLPPFLGAAKSLALKDARGGPFYVWSSMGVYIGEEKVYYSISYDQEVRRLMLVKWQGNFVKSSLVCDEDKNTCSIIDSRIWVTNRPTDVTMKEADEYADFFFVEIDKYGLWEGTSSEGYKPSGSYKKDAYGPAVQGRWELVLEDKNGDTYIDAESIVMVSPGRYLYWERFYPRGDQKEEFKRHLRGGPNVDKFAYVMTRYEADCSVMKKRIHYLAYYSGDDKIILHDTGKISEWYDFPPGSLGEAVLKRICMQGNDAKEM